MTDLSIEERVNQMYLWYTIKDDKYKQKKKAKVTQILLTLTLSASMVGFPVPFCCSCFTGKHSQG